MANTMVLSTTLATMVDCMDVVQRLVAGETVMYNDQEIKLPWIDQGAHLPMWGAGYGPRALATIGEHADGFVLQLADTQVLAWTMEYVVAVQKISFAVSAS